MIVILFCVVSNVHKMTRLNNGEEKHTNSSSSSSSSSNNNSPLRQSLSGFSSSTTTTTTTTSSRRKSNLNLKLKLNDADVVENENDKDKGDKDYDKVGQNQQQQQQQQQSSSKNRNEQKKKKSIREWGCDRTETPLIFVHNGKSGGGGVRARFAASATNYHRQNEWNAPNKDQHYYPIHQHEQNEQQQQQQQQQSNESNESSVSNTTTIRKGKFCNSLYPHYIDIPEMTKTPLTSSSYEGSMSCNATTPLGIIFGCPHPYKRGSGGMGLTLTERKRDKRDKNKKTPKKKRPHYESLNCPKCDDDYYLNIDYYIDQQSDNNRIKEPLPTITSLTDETTMTAPAHTTCDIVYASHNNFGSELNWLPPRYLKEYWWDNSIYGGESESSSSSSSSSSLFDRYWFSLLDDRERRQKQLIETIQVIENSQNTTTNINEYDETIDPDIEKHNKRWCPSGYRPIYGLDGKRRSRFPDTYKERPLKYDRPSSYEDYKGAYQSNGCSRLLSLEVDTLFNNQFYNSNDNSDNDKSDNDNDNGIDNGIDYDNKMSKSKEKNYSSVYASIPVQRVTMLRDPWSWIVSKFYWHKLHLYIPPKSHNQPYACQRVDYKIVARDQQKTDSSGRQINSKVPPVNPITGIQLSWVEQFCFAHLIKLCGNDCRIRYENGLMTLNEIENQVEDNLRYAFSIVGLLNETESFYNMITDRIQYVNMTYNPSVQGLDHATPPTTENIECKKLFTKNTQFQQYVRDTIPSFAALERIYNVGVQVNRFQKNELKTCMLRKGKQSTNGIYKKSTTSSFSSNAIFSF